MNNQLESMVGGGNLQELARYALSAGSVLNRKVDKRVRRNFDPTETAENDRNSDVREVVSSSVY